MSQFKFYLDDLIIDDPDGWDELKTTIRRDDLFNGITVVQDGQLEFTGEAYHYLYDKLLDNFCNSVTIRVLESCGDDTYREIIKGRILVSGCKFNEKTCKVACEIEDQSFFTLINNNKNIKTSPFTDRTKNGEVMTIATTYNLDIYSVGANALVRSNAQAVRVEEAFRVLVAFMTDNQVQFESDTFGIGGEWEGLCVTTGYQLRTATAEAFPQFSFQQLYSEVKARIPIGLRIVDPYGSPIIKIEALENLYQSNVAYDFTAIDEIVTSVDQNKLYAKVALKTGATDSSVTLPFPEEIDFFGWKEEEFFITGQCNLDTTLELNNNWILSSNVIQSTVQGDQGQDSDLFLIDSTLTSATDGRTTNTDFLQVTKYFYNERLTNANTIIRYIGFVPNSIASYLSTQGSGTFRAYLPTDINHTATVAPDNDDYNPLALSAESFDVSGSYNTTTYRFIAPSAGVYTFNSNIFLEANGSGVGTAVAYFQAYMRIFTSAGVLLPIGESFGGVTYGVRMFTPNTFLSGVPWVGIGVGGSYNFTGSAQVVLRQGDQVLMRFSKVGTTGDIDYTIQSGMNTTYFECNSNTLGGGVFQTGEPSNYPALIHEFTYPVAGNDFQSIIENNASLTTFAQEGQRIRYAWIKEVVYNLAKHTATVKLLTDKTTQYAD